MLESKSRTITTEVMAMKRCTLKSRFGLLFFAVLASASAFAVCNPNITLTKPDRIYIDHGDGTVTDTETGLMWMKCTLGRSGADCLTGFPPTLDWKQALEAAKSANAGVGTFGYADWRLPNLNELLSLTEPACDSPAINSSFFPATPNVYYWSSSPASNDRSPWSVYFLDGFETRVPDKNSPHRVRLVRNAQP